MKKGKVWPKYRARWVNDAFGQYDRWGPCWLKISGFGIFIEDISNPDKQTTFNVDPGWVKWDWDEDLQSVRWKYDFFDGTFETVFTLLERRNLTADVHGTLKIHFLYHSLHGGFETTFSHEFDNIGYWGTIGDMETQFHYGEYNFSRLVYWEMDAPTIGTYKLLKADGINPNNTAPATPW